MLVLSRKHGESIEFAGMEIAVRVISSTKTKVQLGIEAPRDVIINRSEQIDRRMPREAASIERDKADSSTQVLEELARVESEVAALAELAGPKDRVIANTIASDAIARLQAVERTVRLTARTRVSERPISEFLNEWAPEAQPTCVRQCSVSYSVPDIRVVAVA
jgi:carbon storage regulator CsrA